MDFRLQKQRLLERAAHVEAKASRENNAQAQDIMRALALLYREMARELEEGSEIPNCMLDLLLEARSLIATLGRPQALVRSHHAWSE